MLRFSSILSSQSIHVFLFAVYFIFRLHTGWCIMGFGVNHWITLQAKVLLLLGIALAAALTCVSVCENVVRNVRRKPTHTACSFYSKTKVGCFTNDNRVTGSVLALTQDLCVCGGGVGGLHYTFIQFMIVIMRMFKSHKTFGLCFEAIPQPLVIHLFIYLSVYPSLAFSWAN